MMIELFAQVSSGWSWFGHFAIGGLLLLVSLFMILLILVQRGRGGGLAGALGGAGGQSAFGTKAGDTFTKVTSYAAIFWILLCMLAIKVLGSGKPPEVDPNAPTEVIAEDASETADEGEADSGPVADNAEATDAAEATDGAEVTDNAEATDGAATDGSTLTPGDAEENQ